MKTNNYDDDNGLYQINGPVSSLAVMWILVCLGFVVWLAVQIFS